MVVHMKMSFFKIFSYFIGFYPNFQIFCSFLLFFFAVSEKLHTCHYYPEEALSTLGQNRLRCLMMCNYRDHQKGFFMKGSVDFWESLFTCYMEGKFQIKTGLGKDQKQCQMGCCIVKNMFFRNTYVTSLQFF